MALVIKDRVKETTTTTGTGTYTLAGAVSGFETFTANLSNSDTTYYVCTDNTDFEVGLGTFTSSGTTLARTTILASSNSNNAVSWSSGTRSVFMTYPADKAVFEDASGHVSIPHDLFIAGGLIDLKNDGGAVSQIKFYCESSNAHAQTLIGAPHSESASNTLTLPSTGGSARLVSTASTATLTNKTLTSPKINEDVALTSTATELNLLDGVSGLVQADFTKLAAIDSSATELNLLDGVSGLVQADFTKLAAVDSTATELNIVDGNTSVGTTAIASGDGIVTNDSGTMRQTNIDTFDTYLSATTKTLTNKTLTSAVLNTGVSGTAILDEDDLSTDSATQLATQQSIKAYVDAQKADMQFVLEDGDGTEVQITKDSEVKFVEGGGLDINWTDTSTGSDGDPYDLTFTVNAAQTGITSVVNTSLEIGRDADNRIKFGTDNQIIFEVSGGDNVIFKASGEIEASSLDISGDADIDGTLEADAITVGGTALNTVIAGVTVTNATTAAVATTVTISDNESTNEENAVIFTAGGDVDGGNIGLESDGDLTYNPSTGTVSATIFKGNIDAVDGDFDGTLEADSITVNGTALATVIAGTTVTDATNSAHVLVTDNESTNEENLITFVEGATDSTGNVGLEMDGNLSYNPSTGTVTATVFKGNIDAVDGDFDGTLEADAITIGGTGIGSIYSAIAGSSNIVTTGALNAGSITSGFGAINNGASNITTTGVGTFASLDISGDIDVDGTANLDVVDIDGALTQDGGAVFNEASADVDFRVESNGSANMLVVDGGNDQVNIGSDADLTNGQIFNINGTYGGTGSAAANIMFFGTGTDAYPSMQILNYSHDDQSINFDAWYNNGWKSSDAGSQFQIVKRSDNFNIRAENGIAAGSAVTWVNHFNIATDGTLTATDTSIGSISDQRLKKNIQDYTYPLDNFKSLATKIFDWENPKLHGSTTQQIGFLAQDVESLDSRWVRDFKIDEDSPDASLLDSDLISKASRLGEKDAMYVSVIQQLITKIETLETKVKALEDA